MDQTVMGMARRGALFVLSSPSGGGKSSLARAMILRDPGIVPSVSVTTRGRRPSEAPGVHYEFLDPAGFERVRASGGLLEWAEVHGNRYGTPRAPVERDLAAGRDVVVAIDWQGARSLRRSMPRDVVSVFLLPPSAEELRARLVGRGEDSEEVIDRRLANARGEIARCSDYDHVLVNADFDDTLRALTEILAAVREGGPAPRRMPAGVESLVRDLDEGLASLDAGNPALSMTA